MDSNVATWLGAVAAAGALIWSHLSLRAANASLQADIRALDISVNENRYAHLDQLYLELLRMRIERPELGRPQPKSTLPDDIEVWESYGCCVWNFIECVTDFCDGSTHNIAAWAPAVKFESEKYRDWLTAGNLKRFRPDFLARVEAISELALETANSAPISDQITAQPQQHTAAAPG